MAALLYAMMLMEWRHNSVGASLTCQMLCKATGYQECTLSFWQSAEELQASSAIY